MLKDDRGQGQYDIFPQLEKGQINISTTYPGVIRAFHRHWFQEDNWFIVSGQFEVVLATVDGEGDHVQKLYLGPGESVNIPRLVWHGFRILGTEPGTLLYYVTNKYDVNAPDEERTIWTRFTDWETEYK